MIFFNGLSHCLWRIQPLETFHYGGYDKLEDKEDDFDTTDDWETCKKSHSPPDDGNFGFKISFLVFDNQVKCWSGKVNPDPV